MIFIDEIPLNRSRTTPIENADLRRKISASNQRNYQRQSAGAPTKSGRVVGGLSSTIKFHWEFGKEIMERIEEILKYKISGVIEISSFLCGCDAVLKEFVEKSFKHPEGKPPASYGARKKIPFLYLIIDEHTADAGVQTRLEAFIDTLSR